MEAGVGEQTIARRVVGLDLHGYHSQRWRQPTVTLPSQYYTFQLVQQALARPEVVVVGVRALDVWRVGVPTLMDQWGIRVLSTNTARVTYISEGNLLPKAWGRVLAALNS